MFELHPNFVFILFVRSVLSVPGLFRDCNCSYDEVAQDVLDESTITADDPLRQEAVEFFDNKFGSLVPLKVLFFVL